MSEEKQTDTAPERIWIHDLSSDCYRCVYHPENVGQGMIAYVREDTRTRSPVADVKVVSTRERDELIRAIAESDIAASTLDNKDIDDIVDLFEGWLEVRAARSASTPATAPADLGAVTPEQDQGEATTTGEGGKELALSTGQPIKDKMESADRVREIQERWANFVNFRQDPAITSARRLADIETLLSIGTLAVALCEKLRVVHGDSRYRGVWVMAQLHQGQYAGPTYTAELAALTDALSGVTTQPEDDRQATTEESHSPASLPDESCSPTPTESEETELEECLREENESLRAELSQIYARELQGNSIAEAESASAAADEIVAHAETRRLMRCLPDRNVVASIIAAHSAALTEKVWDECIAVVGQVRLRLWRQYTDSQIVMLNMVVGEVVAALEAKARAAKENQ